MNLILTPDEFKSYKDVGKKIDVDKINDCIMMAQNVDLYDILNDFIFDVIDNKDSAEYQDLLSGSAFTIDGKNYYQVGLKRLLADFTYSRFLYAINVNLTPYGAVSKVNENSTPVDRNILKDLAKQIVVDADIKFGLIDKYLKQNSSVFTRYKTGNNPSINTSTQRFSIIK